MALRRGKFSTESQSGYSKAQMLTKEHTLIAEDLAAYVDDPLGAVLYGFPWGEGELSDSQGPRYWQSRVLEAITEHLSNPDTAMQPCQIVISSGHDAGKSALI